MNTQSKTRFLTQFSILLAIEAIFCFTPLGSLPIGPIVATLAHVPVILTAILLGVKAGTLMGFFTGLFSFIVWTFLTPPTSAAIAFIFTPFYSLGEYQGNFGSLLICFAPRILMGTLGALIFIALKKLPGKMQWLRYALAGLVVPLVNTLGVMGLIWVFFGQMYESLAGMTMGAIIVTTLTTNGLMEAIIGVVVGLLICMPLKLALDKFNKSAR